MDKYRQTFDTWNKLASSYQDKFMDLDLYDDTYDQFCSLIEKQDAAVFEIGCGPGNITRYLLSKRPDLKIEATDVAPAMIELAKINNPGVTFSVMDCREIDELDRTFDAIVCGFCMPYLSKEDCLKLIGDCSHLLNPGGIFYFSIIEDEYSKSGYQTSSNGEHSVFVYLHEAGYLLESVKENKLELIALKRKTYSRGNGTVDTHAIFIARKNLLNTNRHQFTNWVCYTDS